MTRSPAKVAVVQPYVPVYRVDFFAEVAERLAAAGHTLVVTAPAPAGDYAQRLDAAAHQDWSVPLPPARERTFRGVTFTSTRSRPVWGDADVVIAPAAANFLDSLRVLWWPSRARPKVGLWGHIDDFVSDPHVLDKAIERRMLRRCDHVFAYTDRGATFARQQGVPAARITTMNNTIDVGAIFEARATVTDDDVAAFRAELGIDPARRAYAYIGAIDEVKRIDFLRDTLDALQDAGDDSVFLVAGSGADAHLLQPAVERGQAVMVGYADARAKALMGRVATAIVNPGRIGLLAIDALALGLPVVTSDYRYHGPEVEYLHEGESLFTLTGDARSFADVLTRMPKPHLTTEPPALSGMVDAFVEGIERMLT